MTDKVGPPWGSRERPLEDPVTVPPRNPLPVKQNNQVLVNSANSPSKASKKPTTVKGESVLLDIDRQWVEHHEGSEGLNRTGTPILGKGFVMVTNPTKSQIRGLLTTHRTLLSQLVDCEQR